MGQSKIRSIFAPIKPQNEQAAVVYLYRPDTKWNRQEIAAQFIYNGNEFQVYYIIIIIGLNCQQELIVFCKSSFGIHFQKPKYIDFTVDAGTSYYLNMMKKIKWTVVNTRVHLC
jgi:hypothetical protein